MSLQPGDYQRIPARTVRTAWAACPKGTPAMLVRDRLDVLFEDEEFTDLYPADGRPGFSPGQLALVSVLQFAEDLSDRAAAQAVRTRIDWKYALGLELEDSGFDHSLLCDFSGTAGRGRRGGPHVRCDAPAADRGGAAEVRRVAADRRDVSAGRGAAAQPPGAGRGEPAGGPGGAGGDRAGVAAVVDRTRVGQAVGAEDRNSEGAWWTGSCHRTGGDLRTGRAEGAGCSVVPGCPAQAAGTSPGGGSATGVDPPLLLGRGRTAPLA